MLVKLVGRTL